MLEGNQIMSMSDVEKAEKNLREIVKILGARILSVMNPNDGYKTPLKSYVLENIETLADHLVSAQEHYNFEQSVYDEIHPLWYETYCMVYLNPEQTKRTELIKMNSIAKEIHANPPTPFKHEVQFHLYMKMSELEPETDQTKEVL